MTLRRRTYPEVVDNLLTAIVKGVAAESHPYPGAEPSAAPFRARLEQPPVAEVVSVYGSRGGQPHRFRKDTDYKLLDDRQTLEWQAGAELPDEGTLINVNYHSESAAPILTDIQTGSVVRTLAEAFALEMAGLYAQLQAVYDAGFVDSASGSSLDKVVSLLGIERVRGGHAAGTVELTRAPGARGAITIPAGTRIITADGSIEYATTDTVTLLEGQSSIRVNARDLEQNDGLPADSLTVLPAALAGVSRVTNQPTAIVTQDETDEQLRTRAKTFLHGSERATLGALLNAVTRQGVAADIEEVRPGLVQITPRVDALTPELSERLRGALREARPAGVQVVLAGVAPPRKVNLQLRLETRNGLLERDLRAAQRAVRDKVASFFGALPSKAPGSVNQLVGAILSVPEVSDVRLLQATFEDGQNVLDAAAGLLLLGEAPSALGRLDIADPALPTSLSVTVVFPEGQPPLDKARTEAALRDAAAYLSTINAAELAQPAPASELVKRTLSYGKLLQLLPLPHFSAPLPRTLAAFDTAAAAPALPDEAAAAPYQVEFTLTLQSGLSHLLRGTTDAAYVLTPFERLALGTVTVQAKNG